MSEYQFKRIAVVEYTATIEAVNEEQARAKLMERPVTEITMWQNRRWMMSRFVKWWPTLMVVKGDDNG